MSSENLPVLTLEEVDKYFNSLIQLQNAIPHATRLQSDAPDIIPHGQGRCLFCNKLVYVDKLSVPKKHSCNPQ